MNKIITCTVAALLAANACAFASPMKSKLMEKEKAAWQAYKDKDAAGFKKVVAPEMIGVYDDGISTMEKEMADMQKWEMKSFEISDFQVTSEGADVAVATYTVKIEGTYDGKDASATYTCGTVWHKQQGEWRAVFHTNVPPAKSS